jgi:hypothetical protein
MATTAHRRTSAAQSADMLAQWRLRCVALEDRVQDLTRALRASEAERHELSLDYKHVLHRLWRANAGMSTRRDR